MLPGRMDGGQGPSHVGSPFMDPALAAMATAGIRPSQQQQGIPPGHQQMMDASRVPTDRRLLEQPWKDPRFFPITIDNVMQYFCQRENLFYDINSDNAIAIMHNPGISGYQLDEMLKQMTGIQFVLVQPSSAPLFVIRKQQRMSPDKITPLCHYYILDGTVYQAPDLHTFLHSRLTSIMDPLRNAFTETLEMLRFTPSKGYFWEFKTKPSKRAEDEEPEDLQADYLQISQQRQKDKKGAEEEDPLSVRATPYQRLRADMLLQHLATQFKAERMEIDLPNENATNGSLVAPPITAQHQQQGCQQNGGGESTSSPQIVDFQGLLFSARPSSHQQQAPAIMEGRPGEEQH